MKTQITKENAVRILEGMVRQQALCDRLGKLLDSDMEEFNTSFDVLEALFNIDFGKMTQETYSEYFDAFDESREVKKGNYTKAAERLYDAMFRLGLKHDSRPEQKEGFVPGVISLLKGGKYQIKGEFGLET